MAWSWSHTAEAYRHAEENVRKQPREWLEVVFAEWRANQGKGGAQSDDNDLFCNRRYERALAYAKRPDVTDEQLADHIWARMEELATCDNGGWNAWCCPFGCGPHTVPFSPEAEEETEEEPELATV